MEKPPTEKSAIQRIARGAIQTFGSTYPARLINFAVLLLLYQILVPEDFGAITTAYSILSPCGRHPRPRLALRPPARPRQRSRTSHPTHFVLSVSLGSISTLLALCIALYSEHLFELFKHLPRIHRHSNLPQSRHSPMHTGRIRPNPNSRTHRRNFSFNATLEFGRLGLCTRRRNHPRSPRRPRRCLSRIRQMGTHPRIFPIQRHLYPLLLHRRLAPPSPAPEPATRLQRASRTAHDPLRLMVLDRRHTQNLHSTLRQTHHQPVLRLEPARDIRRRTQLCTNAQRSHICGHFTHHPCSLCALPKQPRPTLPQHTAEPRASSSAPQSPYSLVLALEANRWIHIFKPDWAPRRPPAPMAHHLRPLPPRARRCTRPILQRR